MVPSRVIDQDCVSAQGNARPKSFRLHTKHTLMLSVGLNASRFIQVHMNEMKTELNEIKKLQVYSPAGVFFTIGLTRFMTMVFRSSIEPIWVGRRVPIS